MPVTRSAKKALRVSHRRQAENVPVRLKFKKSIKNAKKAILQGTDQVGKLLSEAQSALDKAAKNHTIHPNRAARLKSRLAKHATTTVPVSVSKVKKASASKTKKSKSKK